MPQQLCSFCSKLHCHILEGIIVRLESSSLFNNNISALINCYIFDRNIFIYLQLDTRMIKTFPCRNKLIIFKFNYACGKSHDVYFIR
jgi:hypothetical protein